MWSCARRAMRRHTIWARSMSSARCHHAAGPVERRGIRVPGHDGAGISELLHAHGPNTNVGSNSVIFMLEAQAHYIVRALKYMRRKRKTYVAVRAETMADFIARIDGG